MRRRAHRSLNHHLVLVVLASLVPAASVAAALTLSLYDMQWRSALLLLADALALAGGVLVTVMLARDLKRALDDLSIEAGMLGRDRPVQRLAAAVSELDAIGGALEQASRRVAVATARRGAAEALLEHAEMALELSQQAAPAAHWEWDLTTGAFSWSPACFILFRMARDSEPTRARLLESVHPHDRAMMAAWLASLPRDRAVPSVEFRVRRGDGEARTMRCAAAPQRDATGAIVKVAGSFVDVTGAEPQPVAAPEQTTQLKALVESALGAVRPYANAGGLTLEAAIAPDPGVIDGDGKPLREALLAILAKSVTDTPAGGRVALKLTTETDGGILIVLSDTSAGLADRDIVATFAPPGVGAEPSELWRARCRIEEQGGSFALTSVPDHGNRVIVRLPAQRLFRKVA